MLAIGCWLKPNMLDYSQFPKHASRFDNISRNQSRFSTKFLWREIMRLEPIILTTTTRLRVSTYHPSCRNIRFISAITLKSPNHKTMPSLFSRFNRLLSPKAQPSNIKSFAHTNHFLILKSAGGFCPPTIIGTIWTQIFSSSQYEF